jgi:hypothetical protein
LASVPPTRVAGTMLWFNEEKDLGALRTADGERLELPGSAFASGAKPVGRCAGLPVEIELHEGVVAHVAFVEDQPQRRARTRSRR